MAVYNSRKNLKTGECIPGQSPSHIDRPESPLRKTQDRWNPRNPSIRLIRDADKKGRIADESDYADYTDFQFILPKILLPFGTQTQKSAQSLHPINP